MPTLTLVNDQYLLKSVLYNQDLDNIYVNKIIVYIKSSDENLIDNYDILIDKYLNAGDNANFEGYVKLPFDNQNFKLEYELYGYVNN